MHAGVVVVLTVVLAEVEAPAWVVVGSLFTCLSPIIAASPRLRLAALPRSERIKEGRCGAASIGLSPVASTCATLPSSLTTTALSWWKLVPASSSKVTCDRPLRTRRGGAPSCDATTAMFANTHTTDARQGAPYMEPFMAKFKQYT